MTRFPCPHCTKDVLAEVNENGSARFTHRVPSCVTNSHTPMHKDHVGDLLAAYVSFIRPPHKADELEGARRFDVPGSVFRG